MKFKKKPTMVETFRFGIDAYPDWFIEKIAKGDVYVYTPAQPPYGAKPYANIRQIFANVWIEADFGDVIVKDMFDMVYPVKPDIFQAMFKRCNTND